MKRDSKKNMYSKCRIAGIFMDELQARGQRPKACSRGHIHLHIRDQEQQQHPENINVEGSAFATAFWNTDSIKFNFAEFKWTFEVFC